MGLFGLFKNKNKLSSNYFTEPIKSYLKPLINSIDLMNYVNTSYKDFYDSIKHNEEISMNGAGLLNFHQHTLLTLEKHLNDSYPALLHIISSAKGITKIIHYTYTNSTKQSQVNYSLLKGYAKAEDPIDIHKLNRSTKQNFINDYTSKIKQLKAKKYEQPFSSADINKYKKWLRVLNYSLKKIKAVELKYDELTSDSVAPLMVSTVINKQLNFLYQEADRHLKIITLIVKNFLYLIPSTTFQYEYILAEILQHKELGEDTIHYKKTDKNFVRKIRKKAIEILAYLDREIKTPLIYADKCFD